MQSCYCVIIFDVNDEIAGTAFLRVGIEAFHFTYYQHTWIKAASSGMR